MRFDTRRGIKCLRVSCRCSGRDIPFFVVERTRSGQALIQVIQEAVVNGISTGKVERLAG